MSAPLVLAFYNVHWVWRRRTRQLGSWQGRDGARSSIARWIHFNNKQNQQFNRKTSELLKSWRNNKKQGKESINTFLYTFFNRPYQHILINKSLKRIPYHSTHLGGTSWITFIKSAVYSIEQSEYSIVDKFESFKAHISAYTLAFRNFYSLKRNLIAH